MANNSHSGISSYYAGQEGGGRLEKSVHYMSLLPQFCHVDYETIPKEHNAAIVFSPSCPKYATSFSQKH